MSDTPADDLRELLTISFGQSFIRQEANVGDLVDRAMTLFAQDRAKLLQGLLAEMPKKYKAATGQETIDAYMQGFNIGSDYATDTIKQALQKVTEE